MKSFWLHIVLLISSFSLAQQTYTLNVEGDSFHFTTKKTPTHFKDSIEAKKFVQKMYFKAIEKGYLLASIDNMKVDSNHLNVKFYRGDRFTYATIHMKNEVKSFLKTHNAWNEKKATQLRFTPKEVSTFLQEILNCYAENGYPFVSTFFSELKIEDGKLEASLQVNPNAYFTFTKIHLVGNPIVSEKLISSYIQLQVGDAFNQTKINEISGKLKLIPFIQELKPAELVFTPEGVELFLYLKSKPVSLANGVVGIQQDPIKGDVFLTGDLRLKLVNSLKKAETLELNWRSIQAQTSSLKTLVNAPNLFRSPFGVDGQFQLFKRDSSFLELKTTLGVQYALKQGNYLKVLYRKLNSSVLPGGLNNPTFSSLRTVENNFYGIALQRQTLDYLPNPRKGMSLLVEGTIGTRKFNDSTEMKAQLTFKSELQFAIFIPLAKRHVLKIGNSSEVYLAPSYYENEVFRFGGQQTMRGFNEEELKATSRTVSTLEYRFLVDQNSFLFAFYDQCWYENKASGFATDTPFGFGLGFAFATSIGNFSVSYAIGSQQGNPVLLRDGKVHFGYIAFF